MNHNITTKEQQQQQQQIPVKGDGGGGGGGGGARSKRYLNEAERLEIISKLTRSPTPNDSSSSQPQQQPKIPSKRQLARHYNVSEGAIRKIWKNRHLIQKRSSTMTHDEMTRVYRTSKPRYEKLEDLLYDWMIRSAARDGGGGRQRLAPMTVIRKAKQIAARLTISEDAFKASWQWLARFRARRGVKDMMRPCCRHSGDDGGGVDVVETAVDRSDDGRDNGCSNDDDNESEQRLLSVGNDCRKSSRRWDASVNELIAKYDLDDVYYMHDMSLLYRTLPPPLRRLLLLPTTTTTSNDDEMTTTTPTTLLPKKSPPPPNDDDDERVSLLLCCNLTGRHKLPCTMMGTSSSPPNERLWEWPLPYLCVKNGKGRMTVDDDVRRRWCREVFVPSVKRRLGGGSVLLIIEEEDGGRRKGGVGRHLLFDGEGVVAMVVRKEMNDDDIVARQITKQQQPNDNDDDRHGGIFHSLLTKHYRASYLEDIVAFHKLDDATKARKATVASRLERDRREGGGDDDDCAAGVSLGRPATLLDAARYVTRAWEALGERRVRRMLKMERLGVFDDDGEDDTTTVPFMDHGQLLQSIIDGNEGESITEAIDEMRRYLSCKDELISKDSHKTAEDEENTEMTSDVIQGNDVSKSSHPHVINELYDSIATMENHLQSQLVKDLAGDSYSHIMSDLESLSKRIKRLADQHYEQIK